MGPFVEAVGGEGPFGEAKEGLFAEARGPFAAAEGVLC